VALRVLSARALNRALLARQLLLQRARLPLTRALERVGGLQMQYAPSAYVGLWTRLHDVRREALTTALEQRRAVQGTLLRSTIHVVSARDYPLFVAGIARTRQVWWQRTQRAQAGGADVAAAARRVREALSSGPRRQSELIALLEAEGFPRSVWAGVGLWVDLVRVPPSGTWERRRADLFATAEDWVGASSVSEAEGLVHLVRRYLGAFGPAALADAANWAGVPVTTMRPVVERLALRRFRDEDGNELLDLPRAPLPDPDTPAPVRFLPTWDATLLVHARRTQILPERYRRRIFSTKTPHSFATVLVDGAVAGTWYYDDARVHVEPFEPLPASVRREVHDEAARLGAFHAG
jgi:hypothetical protein